MSKRTNKYGMIYFEQGDRTSAQYEMQRWETLDAQLSALFAIMGNGVINGWGITQISDGGLSCAVAPGSGHVGFVAVTSTETATIENLVPSTTNYIYAQLTNDSYWTKNVSFVAFIDQLDVDVDKNLYLGSVVTNDNSVISVDSSERTELGFLALINSAVEDHRHTGGTDNPDPINLSTEVQGILGSEHFPDIDASKLTGVVNADRLPKIDHNTKMTGTGQLTHAQLDSYVETLSIDNQSLMGEVSTTNLLQLILALKHVYPDIDEFLVNEVAFIPGISPDDYIDTVNTTAIVDTRTAVEGGQHTITGVSASAFEAHTKGWDTNATLIDYNTQSDTWVNGDAVHLSTSITTLVVDDLSGIANWAVSTQDLSSVPSGFNLDTTDYITAPSSGILTIGAEDIAAVLLLVKTFDGQDWSDYDQLTFYIKTENVNHGDLFFSLWDTVAGEQNSSQKVLDRNTLTINEDTLEAGWQIVTIDLRTYTRTSISKIEFLVSTQEGWDTSKEFDLNIDDFVLNGGNKYEEDGYIRYIYGSDIAYNFWRLRWESEISTEDDATGVNLQFKTRVANNLIDLDSASWSSYLSVSGSEIVLPSDALYKYIEIEAYFTASDTLENTAYLRALYLDYTLVSSEGNFEYDSRDDWEAGKLYNIDTESTPGSIKIDDYGNYGKTVYGTDGAIRKINDDFSSDSSISGSSLPRTTNQVLNDVPSSLGLVTGVATGNNGTVWVSDFTNNRVLELDQNGKLVTGFYGSYLEG